MDASTLSSSRNPSLCESQLEYAMLKAMLDRGLLPVQQKYIAGYRADFAFPAEKIVVEIDGEYWHKNNRQKYWDAFRDARMKRLGWTVLRFWGDNVVNKTTACVDIIQRYVERRKSWHGMAW